MINDIKEIQKSIIEARIKLSNQNPNDAIPHLMSATLQTENLKEKFKVYTQWMESFNAYNKKKETKNV